MWLKRVILNLFVGLVVLLAGYIGVSTYETYRAPTTRLLSLAQNGNVTAQDIEGLINQGADANTKDFSGRTPLSITACMGYVDCVQVLIAHHADVNLCDDSGQTPLDAAVESNNLDCINLLIKAGAKPSRPRSSTSYYHGGYPQVSSLARAVEFGSPEIVKALIAAGADVNVKDFDGDPLLCDVRNDDVALALINAGANVNSKDRFDEDPPFMRIAQYCSDKSIKAMIAHGADPNMKDRYQETPLKFAAFSGKSGNVKALLDAGAKPDVYDERGETPLICASSKSNNEKSIQLLVDAGANINEFDYDGLCPLSHAGENGAIGNMKQLLALGGNPNNLDRNKISVLMHVADETGAQNELADAIKRREKDHEGFSSYDDSMVRMYQHILNMHPAALKLLLSAGATMNAKDRWGKTVLNYAEQSHDKKLVDLLISAGVDVNTRDLLGKTALDYAEQSNDKKLIDVLKAAGAKE